MKQKRGHKAGEPLRKRCWFENRWWDSQRDCARALGISEHTLGEWLKKGYTCFDDRNICRFEGHECKSWAELGKALDVSSTTAKRWAEQGYRNTSRGVMARKRCRVHDKIYESEVAAAKANGVTKQAISKAILSGAEWAEFVEEAA